MLLMSAEASSSRPLAAFKVAPISSSDDILTGLNGRRDRAHQELKEAVRHERKPSSKEKTRTRGGQARENQRKEQGEGAEKGGGGRGRAGELQDKGKDSADIIMSTRRSTGCVWVPRRLPGVKKTDERKTTLSTPPCGN